MIDRPDRADAFVYAIGGRRAGKTARLKAAIAASQDQVQRPMTDEERERAFMEPIERELARKVDNSDEALVRRAYQEAMQLALSGRSFPRTISVEYDNAQYELRNRVRLQTFNYTAVVAFEPDPKSRTGYIGRVVQKPRDLRDKPKDPFVRYLIDETKATPP